MSSLEERLAALPASPKEEQAPTKSSSNVIRIKTQMHETTAGRIRSLCAANPKHPLSEGKLKSVEGLTDGHKVICHQVDLEAILDNKEVVTTDKEVVQDGKLVIERSFSLGKTVTKTPDPNPFGGAQEE